MAGGTVFCAAATAASNLTTFHRDERLGNTYAMYGKCNYEI